MINRFGEIPSGTVDGANKDFTTSTTPDLNSLKAFVNGLFVFSSTDTNIVTFESAPKTGDEPEVNYTITT